MTKSRMQAAYETKLKLMSAASHLFATRGFDGTSVEDIATEAGFTHGAIYKHFANKEELFLESFRFFLSPRLTKLFDKLEEQQDLEVQIAFLAETFLTRWDNDPEWVMLEQEFWLFAMRRPHLHAQVAELYDRLRNFYAAFNLREWRRRARRLGVESDALLSIVSALLEGLGRQHYAAPASVDTQFVQMSLRAVMGMRRTIPDHVEGKSFNESDQDPD